MGLLHPGKQHETVPGSGRSRISAARTNPPRREIYSLVVWRPESKVSVSAGPPLPGIARKILRSPHGRPLWVSSVCLDLPGLLSSPVIGSEPTLPQCDPILTWSHLQRPHFQLRSHAQFPWTYILRDTVQPSPGGRQSPWGAFPRSAGSAAPWGT